MRNHNIVVAAAVAVALLVTPVAISLPAVAGRCFCRDRSPACARLAAAPGVYAVWRVVIPIDRTIEYEVVLQPGARAGDVAPRLRDIVAAEATPTHIVMKQVDLWTYHDPLSGSDFRQVMSSLFPGPIGFPDYRGNRVTAIAAQFDPTTGKQVGSWRIERIYADPAVVRQRY